MSWIYKQLTGEISRDGALLAKGYSGFGFGKNNPGMQNHSEFGPLPRGTYTIGDPEDRVKQGPYVLPLSPNTANEMFGRAGFLVHGDSLTNPGTASEGCIVLPLFARQRIHESLDKILEVIEK